ncbi:hypothetical protein CALVIDRAFT_540370 [Calocera viscosa TUFC12733]|uniref:DUF6535 domain-containing protein n=1 Tax=Calocera viscosa (strain TUFC12733) TaxID=1330018 RepID=A0A167J068_CALVF|nr:hypothetical protein CALVIDRAFT_540370 [Calocera viscosa TUFC12733]
MVLGREQPLPEDFWAVPTLEEKPAVLEGPVRRHFVNNLPTETGMGPDAAIWPLYNEEADKADKEMVETYNGGMENLLVFVRTTAFVLIHMY